MAFWRSVEELEEKQEPELWKIKSFIHLLRKENGKISASKSFLLILLLIRRTDMDIVFFLLMSSELRFYWGTCSINSLSHQFKAIILEFKMRYVSTMLTFTNSVRPLLSWSWWISTSGMILMSYKSALMSFCPLISVLVDCRNNLAEKFCPNIDSNNAKNK